MADNQKKQSSKESKKKSGKYRKSRSRIRDGVVLRASVIERERERLYRRPRAALYPLLPIMEPTKFRRQSVRVTKTKKRHRKHCRKRLHQVEPEESRARSGLNSRTRLVATTSESDGGSLACSKQPATISSGFNNQCPRCSPAFKPALLSDWGSIELYADGGLVSKEPGTAVSEVSQQQQHKQSEHHHHHYHHRSRHRMCHHYKPSKKFEDQHRISVTSTRSLDDLRGPSRGGVVVLPGRRRMRMDPEAGRLGDDKDSASSNSRSRKIVSFIVGSVASFILLMCVALVAVTLRLTPAIDELVRKENEDMYRARTNLPSTAAPVPESSTAGIDNVTTTGHPG